MSTKQTEALKLALEALKMCRGLIRNNIENLVPIASPNPWFSQDVDHAIAAIREALAEQPAQDQGQSCYCPECERLSKELAALKGQQQEPVAWITQGGKGWLRWHNKNDDHLNKTSVPLYKHPKRKPLSDAEIALISAECSLRTPSDIYFARAIEAAHGIKE